MSGWCMMKLDDTLVSVLHLGFLSLDCLGALLKPWKEYSCDEGSLPSSNILSGPIYPYHLSPGEEQIGKKFLVIDCIFRNLFL